MLNKYLTVFLIVTYLALSIGMSSCSKVSSESPSTPKIINGQTVSETRLPGVKLFNGVVDCTGTFITPTLFMTALHCINGHWAQAKFRINGKDYHGKYFYKHRQTDVVYKIDYGFYDVNRFFDEFAFDLGIVAFEPIVSQSLGLKPGDFIKVSNKPFSSGNKVTLVGYGRSNHAVYEDPVKRIGINTAEFTADQRYIKVTGSAAPNGNTFMATASMGDSGGPLINQDGYTIGVFSFFNPTREGFNSYYINFNHPKVLEFLKNAVECERTNLTDCNFPAERRNFNPIEKHYKF